MSKKDLSDLEIKFVILVNKWIQEYKNVKYELLLDYNNCLCFENDSFFLRNSSNEEVKYIKFDIHTIRKIAYCLPKFEEELRKQKNSNSKIDANIEETLNKLLK